MWIADASTTPPGAAYRATRIDFERRALGALPPAAASHVDVPRLEPGDVAPPPRGIVVYGAAWCGACADARAWLEARGVVHTFRDVERDAEAARDAVATCVEVGAPTGRIPVIDVAGRVLVGFDPVRLATILGEPI